MISFVSPCWHWGLLCLSRLLLLYLLYQCPTEFQMLAWWHMGVIWFPDVEALWKRTRKLSFWVFMKSSLFSPVCLNHWSVAIDSTVKPLSPLHRNHGVGLKVPILYSHGWFSWLPASTLGRDLKVTSFTKQKTPLLSTIRKFQGFGELWARNSPWRPTIYDKYILVIWTSMYFC